MPAVGHIGQRIVGEVEHTPERHDGWGVRIEGADALRTAAQPLKRDRFETVSVARQKDGFDMLVGAIQFDGTCSQGRSTIQSTLPWIRFMMSMESTGDFTSMTSPWLPTRAISIAGQGAPRRKA